MTRKFLEELGLEKEVIDKILDENSADIGKEIGKTNTAKADLATLRGELDTVRGQLEELQKSNGNASDLQKQLEALQEKYTTDTGALQQQINDRDYTDAISKAISGANNGNGLKFSSKSAQAAFVAALREKGLELKDGAIDGFDEFVKTQKDADPAAFVSDTPTARFAGRIGTGGAPTQPKSRAAELAAKYSQNLYGSPKEGEK